MISKIEQLYALKIPEIRDLFIESIQNVVDQAKIDEMIKAIENNDIDGLYKASGFTPAMLNSFLDGVESVYKSSADILINSWPKNFRYVFNIRNEKVEEDLKTFSSNFVQNITEEVKENLRFALSDGIARGNNPRQTALDIVGRINSVTKKREGGLIGLSTNQVRWVSNVRKYLETLNEDYLKLGLRDKRFDSIVKKAIAEGKKLNKDEIEKLVTAYEKKALKYRADSISRTETIQSINRSERAAIEQSIDEGYLKSEQVKKWWDDTGDGRTRLTHLELGKKYNKENMIAFDEPFITSTGDKLMYPGDTSLGASAREIIHCRCKAVYDVNFSGSSYNG